jgi:hypothetical protein
MHIKKYDFDYSRRFFMEKTAKGIGGAGVLTSLWPLICESAEIFKAYPEELMDIELYTKGKIKVGDVIDKDNIDIVKDLIDPLCYQEVTQQGRKFWIHETETDIRTMYPYQFLEATIKNQGRAKFDDVGNVWNDDGKPWIGGNPFPDPQTGWEAIANLTLNWGRHDQSMYAVPIFAMGLEGEVDYEYDLVWAEENMVARVNDPNGPYVPGEEDKLRYQSTWFTYPNDVKGTAFMNIWPYDQRQFPDLFGYLPAFKRVRRFPTNQRFEPLVAGINLFLSDAWAAGDPMLTWGNFKIIHRGPFLGSTTKNWMGDRPGWDYELVGGPQGKSFFYAPKELIPEVVVIEGEPTGYPRAPVSKKRVYIDVRNMAYPQMITFDRRGDLWKSFEPGYGQYKKGDIKYMDGDHIAWSWNWVLSDDIQTGRVTRFHQADKVRGGYRSEYNTGPMKDQYMTVAAMRRLGT